MPAYFKLDLKIMDI